MAGSGEVPFGIGVVSDEIHSDPAVAAAVARSLGMSSVEINTLWGKKVHELDDEEVACASATFGDAELDVLAICPPFLKPVYLPESRTAFDTHDEYRSHLAILDRSIALTRRFRGPTGGRVPFVRVFSFRKSGIQGLGNPSPRLPNGGAIDERTLDLIAHGLRRAVERADDAGVVLALENVRSCWGNSGTNAARIVERVGSPVLQALWDPANAFVSGETFPTGWNAVKNHVVHVHLKDASVVDEATGETKWECIGLGEAAIAEEVRALAAACYRGAVHIETHWKPEDGTNGTPAAHAGLVELIRRARRVEDG